MGGLTGTEFAYTNDAFNSSLNQNDAKGDFKKDIKKRMVSNSAGGFYVDNGISYFCK